MKGEKSGIKILLFVEHGNDDPTHSIYLIEPPMEEKEEIDSEGFAVDSISPIKTIEKGGDCCFLDRCAMCRLGSCFYFFGGLNPPPYLYYLYAGKDISELELRVQVFNIDFPESGFHSVASLNAPKDTPSVFSVKGLIYALGSSLRGCNLNKGKGSGIFERYYPDKDYWEVLPDPPKPFGERNDMNYIDSATVVRDRYVFVGNTIDELYLVFDLDEQHWTSFPKSSPLSRFPYGSLYVDRSLYYLTGLGSWKPGTQFDIDVDSDDNEVRLVKRSPLPSVNKPSLLLKSICLMPGNEQLMSTYTDLEGDICFSHIDFSQWRDIFHLGGHFFCYVSTSQLVDKDDVQKFYQPYCRGVWIKVFEEVVPDRNSTTKHPHFRTLASFSYRITTPFHNYSYFIRCSAFGSVPHSWVKVPLSKKQVGAKEREACKAEQSQHECGGGSEGQRDGAWEKKQVAAKDREALKTEQTHNHGVGSEGQTDGYVVQKILAAREDEYSRLKAELAKKDELLKQYELFMAKSGVKMPLTGQ